MGLKEILDEIQKEADTKDGEVLSAAKLEADQIVMNKLEELDAFYGKQRQLLDLDLKRLKAKLTAKAELDVQREKQKAELDQIDGLLKESYHYVVDSVKKDEKRYLEFLKKLVARAVRTVEKGELGVSFSKEDEHLFDSLNGSFERKLKLLPPTKMAGGVVCISGDSYIDYSLDNIFEQLKPGFIKMIADAMK